MFITVSNILPIHEHRLIGRYDPGALIIIIIIIIIIKLYLNSVTTKAQVLN